MSKKYLKIGGILICAFIILASYIYTLTDKEIEVVEPVTNSQTIPPTDIVVEESNVKIIGTSIEGRPIETYSYGNGTSTLLFVGGIHGGYEWNSTLLAYEFIDNLESKSVKVPDNLRVVVIPTLNPDGLYSVIKKVGRFTTEEIPTNNAHETGQGRFNANEVDLNRNFDCKWKPESTWRGKIVKAGSSVFSEPEAIALRDFVLETNPKAVVFWHSQANTVYASECENGVLEETLTIMDAYAKSAGYRSVSTFDAYPVTGDAEGWLASINIPAITVELKTRTSSEWEQNRKGIETLFDYYQNK